MIEQPPVRPGEHLGPGGAELGVLAEVGNRPVEAGEEPVVVGSHGRQYGGRCGRRTVGTATRRPEEGEFVTLPGCRRCGHPEQERGPCGLHTRGEVARP